MYMFQSVLRIRIRDPVPIWPKIRIRDEHFGSYFRELRNNFLGYSNSLMQMRIRIRDPTIFLTRNAGFGMEKIQIRNKHPGSATLVSLLPFVRISHQVYCIPIIKVRTLPCLAGTCWTSLDPASSTRTLPPAGSSLSSTWGTGADTPFSSPSSTSLKVRPISSQDGVNFILNQEAHSSMD